MSRKVRITFEVDPPRLSHNMAMVSEPLNKLLGSTLTVALMSGGSVDVPERATLESFGINVHSREFFED